MLDRLLGETMAAGEYVSVSSQADSERAKVERERNELAEGPDFELEQLTNIYIERGLTPTLAAGWLFGAAV